jgi:hypothetical protein
MSRGRESLHNWKISTVAPFVLASSDQLLLMPNFSSFYIKQEEVNCIEPPLQLVFPAQGNQKHST